MQTVFRLSAVLLPLAYLVGFFHGLCATLTDAQRQSVLKAHNDLRSTLASGDALNKNGTALPSGKNIYELSWSTDAESAAQEWADNCVFGHSDSSQRNGAGQNIYMTSAEQDFAQALNDASQMWWDELADYGITQLKLTEAEFNRGVGHFTQMAWAATTQIGCGVAWCPNQPMTFVVCNYSPAGNYINEDIYEAGSPCKWDSDCTANDGSTCNVGTGLCLVAGQTASGASDNNTSSDAGA